MFSVISFARFFVDEPYKIHHIDKNLTDEQKNREIDIYKYSDHNYILIQHVGKLHSHLFSVEVARIIKNYKCYYPSMFEFFVNDLIDEIVKYCFNNAQIGTKHIPYQGILNMYVIGKSVLDKNNNHEFDHYNPNDPEYLSCLSFTMNNGDIIDDFQISAQCSPAPLIDISQSMTPPITDLSQKTFKLPLNITVPIQTEFKNNLLPERTNTPPVGPIVRKFRELSLNQMHKK